MGRGLPHTGGGGSGGGHTGGGYLCRPPPENGRKINCGQSHYGPVSGDRVTPGYKGVEVVVGSGVPGPVKGPYRELVGGTGIEVGR